MTHEVVKPGQRWADAALLGVWREDEGGCPWEDWDNEDAKGPVGCRECDNCPHLVGVVEVKAVKGCKVIKGLEKVGVAE
jgi:hypothetical protein